MALTEKLTSIADAIRDQSGKADKLTLAQMPNEIAGLQGLNFTVVGGAAAPASPAENTIWVNTTAAITSWIFSASQPESPSTGMVWFSVGTSSGAEFNALKKNSIQVCPLSAKQYVGGAWVERKAKSYQGGEWVDWIRYIVSNGIIQPIGLSTRLRASYPCTVTQHDGYVNIQGYTSGGSKYNSGIMCDELIDLTGISKIIVDMNVLLCGSGGSNAFNGVSVIVTNGTGYGSIDEVSGQTVAYALTTQTGRQILELPISLSGKYYIGFALGYASSGVNNIDVYDFYCM